MIVEEELSADPIRARVDLRFQVSHPLQRVGRGGVSFRKSSNPDSEGVPMPVTKALDVLHEFRGVLEFTGIRITPVLRWISPEGQNGGDARLGIPLENHIDLVPGVADARQMGDCGDLRLFQQADHEIVREPSGGSSSTVGDGDE